MSSDGSNITNHPTELQGIGGFPSDPETLLYDYGRAFWESEPTGVWAAKATETLGQFAAGTAIIGLSGRNGIGKTMQYMRLLERTIPEMGFGYDAPNVVIDSDVEIPNQTIIDELGYGQVTYGKSGLVAGLARRLVGKQAVVISPGATKGLRRDVLESFMEGWQAARPDTTVYDLGDVNKAPVLPDRAAAVIRAAGGDDEAIAVFTQHDALRNARLFNTWFMEPVCRGKIFSETFGAEDVVGLIKDIVTVGGGSRDAYERARAATSLLLPPSAQLAVKQYQKLFFTNSEFTTQQAIDLYDMAGEPLPKFSEEDITEIGFDPYHKD